MRRFGTMVILLGLLVGVFAGCGRGQKPIPAGAQEIHIVATGSEVRLDPASVHAGEVYLVLDAPLDGGFTFIRRKTAAEATAGPLSDDDLARLARGDSEGTSIEGFSVGCSAEQRAEDRGRTGPCGNVYGPLALTAGKYAFLSGDIGAGLASPPITVLEVLP